MREEALKLIPFANRCKVSDYLLSLRNLLLWVFYTWYFQCKCFQSSVFEQFNKLFGLDDPCKLDFILCWHINYAFIQWWKHSRQMIYVQKIIVSTKCLFNNFVNRFSLLTVTWSDLLNFQTLNIDRFSKSIPLLLDFDQNDVLWDSDQVKTLFLEDKQLARNVLNNLFIQRLFFAFDFVSLVKCG